MVLSLQIINVIWGKWPAIGCMVIPLSQCHNYCSLGQCHNNYCCLFGLCHYDFCLLDFVIITIIVFWA